MLVLEASLQIYEGAYVLREGEGSVGCGEDGFIVPAVGYDLKDFASCAKFPISQKYSYRILTIE